jgi:hypothetical protein
VVRVQAIVHLLLTSTGVRLMSTVKIVVIPMSLVGADPVLTVRNEGALPFNEVPSRKMLPSTTGCCGTPLAEHRHLTS